MPRRELGKDQIDAFRRRTVDAATRLFAARGYDGVTMRSVAEELGVSAMTPYRYVEGKDGLFALVRAEAFRRFADRLELALSKGGSPLARLARLKRGYVRFALDEPDAYRIMFELSQPDPAGHDELGAQSKRAFGTLYRTVADAVSGGWLEGDPLTIAHLVWANTHGLVSLHLAGKLAGRHVRALAAVDHDLDAFRSKRP